MSLPNESILVGLLGTGAAGGYEIERSVRFNSSDSAYLSRTPASAGNRKTWTWAGWVKKVANGQDNTVFSANRTSNYDCAIRFLSTNPDKLEVFQYEGTIPFIVATAAVFRDPSAWYHIAVAFDTTQATSTDRIKVYANGVLQALTGTFPSLNFDADVNAAVPHAIGRWQGGAARYFDGYLADIHFIDGQALDPTDFGEFDDNGIWQPIEYTGSYGTNGFHLDFSDNSSAAALGTDTSGNSNTWTVNNISVTAGAGNDSLVDVPTNGTETDTGVGGEVRGNYCTCNPLRKGSSTSLTNGNLDAATGATNYGLATGTIGVRSGKYYWEITVNSASGGSVIGIVDEVYPTGNFIGQAASSVGYNGNGYLMADGNTGVALAATYTTGDVIGVALDMDTSEVKFYKNNSLQHTSSSLAAKTWFPAICSGGGGNSTFTLNAGQRPFAYTAPSGFKALCTANLDAPVVTKPSEYMDVALYTGNGSTQTISGLEFSPDLVWIKNRAAADSHKLTDTVRGATEELESDTTAAEATNADGLTAFNSDGFDLGADAEYNTNTETYVAWTWDAGSSTVTNTDGSITSSVRANTSAGFSIVTYTGTGSNTTVGHGLGAVPRFLIIKNRTQAASSWAVQWNGIGTNYIQLNTTGAENSSDASSAWNNTNPTSALFTINTKASVNTNSANYVAYCFAPVDGYSSFGSYTGNGSTDGPFVFTNHRPRWILIKRTDTTSNWTIIDTSREGYNVDNDPLYPNLTNAEGTTDLADILSNGFKLRSTDASVNANTGTYIYASFAESPFQYSRAR